jgi:hypothetical protein
VNIQLSVDKGSGAKKNGIAFKNGSSR